MATFLDILFLEHFSNIFVLLFVFVAIYAVLEVKKPFGAGAARGINLMIAFAVSFLFIFAPDAIKIVRFAVPWFLILIIAYVFINIAKVAFGAEWQPDIPRTFGTWTLVFSVVIMLFAISSAIGQKAGPYLDGNVSSGGAGNGDGSVASGSFQENLGATLFHPKVLGVLVILVIMLFAALWIGHAPT